MSQSHISSQSSLSYEGVLNLACNCALEKAAKVRLTALTVNAVLHSQGMERRPQLRDCPLSNPVSVKHGIASLDTQESIKEL